MELSLIDFVIQLRTVGTHHLFSWRIVNAANPYSPTSPLFLGFRISPFAEQFYADKVRLAVS